MSVRFACITMWALVLVLVAPGARAADMVVQASWYKAGQYMANGKRFNPHNPTIVASRTLPLGTRLRLTNLANGRSLIARVQDRGPVSRRLGLDCSQAGAQVLGFVNAGIATIAVTVLE